MKMIKMKMMKRKRDLFFFVKLYSQLQMNDSVYMFMLYQCKLHSTTCTAKRKKGRKEIHVSEIKIN